MKLAHLSDTHLGYYAYGKTAAGRQNQREVDVCATFQRCLDGILERDPDLVIHSGDFFHVTRPSNYSLIWAYKAITRFQARRGGRPFVIIAGNHDTPQHAEAVNILRLFDDIDGVRVETDATRLVELGETSVLCVPHKSLSAGENVSWARPVGAHHAILTLHGMADRAELDHFDFELKETRPDDWTYVALGDWHVHQPYGRNICYAGSTDFTEPDIWGACGRPKGWVYFDSEIGQLEHVSLATRRVIDLPPIDADDLTTEQLGEHLVANATWDDDDLPVVRQRVRNVRYGLEWPLPTERSIAARALFYKVEKIRVSEMPTLLSGSTQAASLETCWGNHIDASPFGAAIDKTNLKQLGLDLLQEVAEDETAPVEA